MSFLRKNTTSLAKKTVIQTKNDERCKILNKLELLHNETG